MRQCVRIAISGKIRAPAASAELYPGTLNGAIKAQLGQQHWRWCCCTRRMKRLKAQLWQVIVHHLKRVQHRWLLELAHCTPAVEARVICSRGGECLPGSNSFTSYCPYLPPAFVTNIYIYCWDKKIRSKNICPPPPLALGRLTMDPSVTWTTIMLKCASQNK